MWALSLSLDKLSYQPVEQYVVRLEVTVREPQVVQRPQRVRSLRHVESGVFLRQGSRAAGQQPRQVAARA